MSEKRLSNEDREKQLRLAITRINKGRAKTKETKISFASVAREAGVSTALIHNHYPDIAELIREGQGRSSRAQRDAKHGELKAEREKNRQLRCEVDALGSQVKKLASVNESMLMEIRELRAKLGSSNVVDLATKR